MALKANASSDSGLRCFKSDLKTFNGCFRWLSGEESACGCKRHRRCEFDPWVGKVPWRRK